MMLSNEIAIVSFYSFIEIEDIDILMPKILLIGKKKYLKGTVLVAPEGVNGSVSGSDENLEFFIKELVKLTKSQDISVKYNYANIHPFQKFKVKLKKEIVALGAGDINVGKLKGEYIEPKNWDNFIERDDVILIDTRNDYEVEVGTFDNAVNPYTKTFKQFPAWVEKNKDMLKGKKIAMCCTGGIRCEKSTAFMKMLGYEEVYHLKGGILQYIDDTGNKSGKWRGDCFVFDDRVAVDNELVPSEGLWYKRGK
jgi:UPF0176 protein